MILEVTQEALDLNYDGTIIETHIDPDNAWAMRLSKYSGCFKQILLIWK
jgi:hypothetical protein